jgi:aldehyde dehydrogenase (NAD+)
MANDSDYALGATIFSRDEKGARALAERIRAGIVVINDMIAPTADPRIPFGGRGRSGFGVTRGKEGLLEMTVTKVIVARRGARPHLDQPADARLAVPFIEMVHGESVAGRLRAFGRVLRAGIQQFNSLKK